MIEIQDHTQRAHDLAQQLLEELHTIREHYYREGLQYAWWSVTEQANQVRTITQYFT